MTKIFLTGMTGLVGSAFTTTILSDKKDYRIVTLCRPNSAFSARERIESVIREQCAFDHVPERADEVLSRIDVIEGNVLDGNIDELMQLDFMQDVDIMFHCAADVNLGKDADKRTYNINYQGTKNMIELAKRLNVREFHYVSTAYVAGKKIGVAKEDELVDSGFNNNYEMSKFNAEGLVRNSGFKYTIYRPSIIVGRLSDGKVRRPLAFYRILEFLAKVKKHQCSKHNLDPLDWMDMQIRFQTFPSERIYFVPIDYVQQAICKLFFKPVCNKTYHLTGNSPVSVHSIAKNIGDTLRIKGISVVDKADDLTPDEKLIGRMIGDLLPYYSSQITFDQSNVIDALGEEFIAWNFDDEHLGIIMKQFLKSFFPNVEWLQKL
jgi:nucleoside-diphosphate-sugar epimerase